MENRPYVKIYDANGEVTNPITKHNPHLNVSMSRSQRKEAIGSKRHRGNNKGNAIVVVGTVKYFKYLQVIPMYVAKVKDAIVCGVKESYTVRVFAGNKTIEHSIAR